jgi:long-chain-fatty-acid--[acyl-carrier-protein] ligase
MVRYRVTIKGLDKLNSKVLNKSGGVLFLPNHPAVFVDPTLIALAVLKRYPIRPLIVEYMYYTPIVHWIMKLMDAIPIPNFNLGSNSLKRKKSEKVIMSVIKDLRNGSNFLIYPAGKLKLTNMENIGGASGVHRIVQDVPEANIVLVRITGLWGSSFSRALTGSVPPLFTSVIHGIKIAFKNLIFFTPKRHVTIEFIPAPLDFPANLSRLELNKYLENWYNRPDGLSEPKGRYPGETLNLVSYSAWKEEYPVVKTAESQIDETIDLDQVPEDVKHKIIAKISSLTEIDPSKITYAQNLSSDLGMDSLDIAELALFLSDQFEAPSVPTQELTTVGRTMAIGAKQILFNAETEEEEADLSNWKKHITKYRVDFPEGKTIPEVFLNNCIRMKKQIACADARTGVVTYDQLKVRVLILAEYIRKLPGDYIGVMLPASVAANACILACLLAGKIPVLVNWTVGTRHLDSVLKVCNLKVIL